MNKSVFVFLIVVFAAFFAHAEDDETIMNPSAAVETPAPPKNPAETEQSVSSRLNSDAPAIRGAQTENGDSSAKDMVCVCKRIKKPQNVKCNRTVEIEEPPQDPKTLKELVQCTPGGYNLTQAQRLLLRKEAKARQEMEDAQELFEQKQLGSMTSCLSGHCNPQHDLNSDVFWVPPKPISPIACYDRCHDENCRPIWRNPTQGWEDWYACVQQCVSGCYVIV
eukprot:c21376_g1_i2.p1 GENE.c21376_g1_i2~~c21376_g1_i2.p1  ORF type:complete len:222 (+),score=103.36 c21376_g1_i2:35-700(+)